MAKSSTESLETQTWGTWEELLLACAVHRYGVDSWDSVAVEVQKRTPSLKSLTGSSCKLKYHDLKRRFSKNDAAAVSKPETDNNDNAETTTTTADTKIPWLEELRKLRVAQLKSELERYDLSIVSLQLEVKRLKEERENTNLSDLDKTDGEKVKDVEPESLTGGEVSDREDHSVNESNSTDPKAESPGAAEEEPETKPAEPEINGTDMICEGTKVEDSCNSVAEESERVGPGNSAESKKESGSDMQRNVEEEEELDEPEENDGEQDRAPAIKSVPVESQPLADFLEILRCHKLGSLFEGRLETQETHEYVSIIRQHIDLATIRTRLKAGWYSGSKEKFFRDLLLLFTNAIVFFGKEASEFLAAMELLQIVSKEMASKVPVPDLLPKEESLVLNDPETSMTLAVKPKMRVLMIACRKRSSIATKLSPLFSGADKKGEQKSNSIEEEPVIDLKQHDKSSDKGEENSVTKKRTRERFNPASKNFNRNSKTRTCLKTNKSSDSNSSTGLSSKAGSQTENVESKIVRDKTSRTNGNSKKKGASNFLDRIKQGSPSDKRSSLKSLKQPITASDSSKLPEQNRSTNRKSGVKKAQNSHKVSVGRRERESRSCGKRTSPKRAPAPPVPSSAISAKRVREAVLADASGRAKKRSRR